MRYLPNAHWMEWIMVVFGAYALYRTFRMRMFYLHTMEEIRSRGENGPMLFRAHDHIYNQNYLVLMSAILTAGAIMYLFYAPPPPPYSGLPQSVVGMLMFIALAFLITLKSRGREIRDRELSRLIEQISPIKGGRREYDPAAEIITPVTEGVVSSPTSKKTS